MIRYRLQGYKKKEQFIYALYEQKEIFVKVATGISVGVKNWDRKRQKVKKTIDDPNRDLKNARLDKIKTKFERLYLEQSINEIPTKEKVKQILIEAIRGKKIDKMTLANFFDVHINELRKKTNPATGKPITKETINKFIILKRNLFEFNEALNFENITKSFYIDFTEWLRVEKDLKPNTIGKYIRALKEVLNRATEEGYNVNKDYKSKDFKIHQVETSAIYLTEEELDNMFDLDLSNNPPLENARNLFLIGCYTGVRFSDIEKIKDEVTANPKNENITIIQEKTGHRVTIPIFQRTRQLLNHNPHNITNQKLNQYIKQVGELAKIDTPVTIAETKGKRTDVIKSPKYKLITTHTARRSFATNSLKRGISAKVIMSITGHKKETSFYKYIRTTGEEDANLLREGWEK